MKTKIKRFENFITEKLGIVEELEPIADLVFDNLIGKSYYRLETILRGQDVKVDFYVDKKFANSGSFSVKSFDNLEFKIKLKKLRKSTIIHELKHLDRTVANKSKSHDKYTTMNHIINFVTNKLDFLFAHKDYAETLSLIIYFVNPDEFEAFFNQIYFDIKKRIGTDMSRQEKIDFIKEELELEPIYINYRHLSKNKFDIRKCFNNNRDLNKFLKEYTRFTNSFNQGKRDFITIPQYLMARINKLMNKYLKDEESDKLYLEINEMVNKSIQKNYKKFYRLYSLLT